MNLASQYLEKLDRLNSLWTEAEEFLNAILHWPVTAGPLSWEKVHQKWRICFQGKPLLECHKEDRIAMATEFKALKEAVMEERLKLGPSLNLAVKALEDALQ